jgi:hypothetical protein
MIAENRGQVLPYVAQTDRAHRAVGWYLLPYVELDGCKCEFCTGARAGEDVYVGYHLRDGIPALHQWATSHAA